jgi:hypothetical protein
LQAATPCTFEAKVRAAQASGYRLAVIFDSYDESLIRMKAEKDEGVAIPSVFLSLKSGLALVDLISRAGPAGIDVFVDGADPWPLFLDSLNLTMLGLVVGFLFVVIGGWIPRSGVEIGNPGGSHPPRCLRPKARPREAQQSDHGSLRPVVLFAAVCGTLFLCTAARPGRAAAPKHEVLPLSDVLALPGAYAPAARAAVLLSRHALCIITCVCCQHAASGRCAGHYVKWCCEPSGWSLVDESLGSPVQR